MALDREAAMQQLPGDAPSSIAYVSDAAAIAQTFHDLIEAARSSIVLQMYLFSGNGETEALRARPGAFPYAHTVAGWLVDRHRRNPEIDIVVVLDTQTLDDPAQTQRKSGPLVRQVLEQAGIPVLNANLFRNEFDAARWFPPPVAGFHSRYRDVPLEAWVRTQQRWQLLHNLEDHRKNICIDAGAWGAVTSHNFWDVAFDWHENLFLVGPPASAALWEQARTAMRDALEIPQRLTPEARARIAALAATPAQRTSAGADVPRAPTVTALQSFGDPSARPAATNAHVEVLTGHDVRPRLLRALEQLAPGARVQAASLYFSDVPLLEAFIAAAARGVRVQVLVDDFAGLTLVGVLGWIVRTFVNFRSLDRIRDAVSPNFELRVHGSRAGAMMHLKSAVFLGDSAVLIGGQANYTPNSFSGAWLETNLVVHGAATAEAFVRQFTALWEVSRPPARRSKLASIALRVLDWLVERVFRF